MVKELDLDQYYEMIEGEKYSIEDWLVMDSFYDMTGEYDDAE